MQCNIDDRGASFRRRMGWGWLVLAAILGAVAFGTGLWWLWIIAAASAAGGAFALFEARHKWCALRAMGIQTKL